MCTVLLGTGTLFLSHHELRTRRVILCSLTSRRDRRQKANKAALCSECGGGGRLCVSVWAGSASSILFYFWLASLLLLLSASSTMGAWMRCHERSLLSFLFIIYISNIGVKVRRCCWQCEWFRTGSEDENNLSQEEIVIHRLPQNATACRYLGSSEEFIMVIDFIRSI